MGSGVWGFTLRASDFALRATTGQVDPTGRVWGSAPPLTAELASWIGAQNTKFQKDLNLSRSLLLFSLNKFC
jgi:hypothetical protein